MPEKMFRDIIDSLEPYKQGIEKVDLFGLGEPLLDKFIFDRIKYVKKKGFKNIAISTNADLLDKKKQDLLLETEIETVIFSIDGIIAGQLACEQGQMEWVKNTLAKKHKCACTGLCSRLKQNCVQHI